MTDVDSQLPDDIAAEKQVSRNLSIEYRDAVFGGIRKFRALRLQAPGIIAEFVLAVVTSFVTVVILFRNIEFRGPIQELGYTVKIIIVVVACFWISRRVWRIIGVANRDRCRYVVRNMWNLSMSGLVIVYFVVKFFYPDFVESP